MVASHTWDLQPRLCAPIGNQTHNLLAYGAMLQPTEPASQGQVSVTFTCTGKPQTVCDSLYCNVCSTVWVMEPSLRYLQGRLWLQTETEERRNLVKPAFAEELSAVHAGRTAHCKQQGLEELPLSRSAPIAEASLPTCASQDRQVTADRTLQPRACILLLDWGRFCLSPELCVPAVLAGGTMVSNDTI